jgi:predicted lipid-binding transport protein (Tim44 family)
MTAAAMGRESGMTMTLKSNRIELSVVCALFIIISVWGIVWDITSGLLTSGIDGIMLAAICLLTLGIFSLMLVVMLWQAGLIPIFRPKEEGKAAESAKPAAAVKSATPAVAAPPVPAAAPAATAAAPAAAPAQKAPTPAQSTPTTK